MNQFLDLQGVKLLWASIKDRFVQKEDGSSLLPEVDKLKYDKLVEDSKKAVITVAGRYGNVVLSKNDVFLENVDNTSDKDKPVSDATKTALALKADKTSLEDYVLLKTADAIYSTKQDLNNGITNLLNLIDFITKDLDTQNTIDTFLEIKKFLKDYQNDNSLKLIIDESVLQVKNQITSKINYLINTLSKLSITVNDNDITFVYATGEGKTDTVSVLIATHDDILEIMK